MTERNESGGAGPLPSWFVRLLVLLPADFRERYGEDFAELIELHLEGLSAPARAVMWLRAGLDVVVVGASLRLGERKGEGGSMYDGRSGHGVGFSFGSLWQDVRHSLRSLRRDPGFSTFSVVIVGLGVGACATVFGVANALLIEPLPFDDPEELVWISNGEFGRGQALSSVSVQAGYVMDLQRESRTLEGVAGYHLFDFQGDHTITGSGGEPERITRLRVTGNFFDLLGVDAEQGRLFTPEEVAVSGDGSVVLMHHFWNRRFGGDPSILGQSIRIDDEPHTVVGVLPAHFDFRAIFAPGAGVDYVAPWPLNEQTNRNGNTLGLIARLADGVPIDVAQQEVETIAASPSLAGLNGFEPRIRPLRDRLTGDYRAALLVLAGAVTLVMLIVCANLSNLLIARGIGRSKEMALRSALGANRGRLVRQLITEALVLAVFGSALGVGIAVGGTELISRMDGSVPLLAQARVDGAALAFALVSALGAGLVFGIAPALRVRSGGLSEAMRDGGRAVSESKRTGGFRRALVVGEVALACVVLVGSGLLTRSFIELTTLDLGFEPEQTIALRIDPEERFESQEARQAYYDDVLDRLVASPTVETAGLTDVLPMGFNRRWSVCGAPGECDGFSPYVRLISHGYVDAMGLTLLVGRDLQRTDDRSQPRVILVSDVFAERMWAGQDPLEQYVYLPWAGEDGWRVIGVVRGMRHLNPEEEPGPELFFPHHQMNDGNAVHLIARGRAAPVEIAAAVGAALRPVDADLPLEAFTPIATIVDRATSARRFVVWLMIGFAGFALLLSLLGIYAVISYSVTRRKREFGVRLALGASSAGVRSNVLRQTLQLAVIGVIIGMGAAVFVARSIEGLLFGVPSTDPLTFVVVPLVLCAIAALAGYVPADRAARLDPLESLRAE